MLRTKVMVGVLAGVVAIAAIAATPAIHAAAKGAHCGWGNCPLANLIHGHIGRLMVLKSELNVTDEQKAKIKETLKADKPEIAKVAKGVWEKRTALLNAVLAEQSDEQAIRKAADDLGKSIGDAAVVASKVVGQVRPVLTSEQREKIKKFRQDNQEATGKFFDKVLKAE
jgi:Spy/CpxP family protein refolding chaperone